MSLWLSGDVEANTPNVLRKLVRCATPSCTACTNSRFCQSACTVTVLVDAEGGGGMLCGRLDELLDARPPKAGLHADVAEVHAEMPEKS